MWILRYLITIEFKLQLFVNEGTGNGLSHLPSKWFSSNLWKYMGDCCTPSYLLETNYQVQKVSVGNRHKDIEYAILWTSFSCRFCPKFCQVVQSSRWVILLGFMRWHKDFSVFFNKWLKQAKLEQGKFTWNIRIFFFFHSERGEPVKQALQRACRYSKAAQGKPRATFCNICFEWGLNQMTFRDPFLSRVSVRLYYLLL